MVSKSLVDFHSSLGSSSAALKFDTSKAIQHPRSHNPIIWWNLLSLDAPTVALLWAVLFARSFRANVHLVSLEVLTACVWLIYVLDRIFDGISAPHDRPMSARHAFYVRRRWTMLSIAAVVFVSTIWLVVTRMDVAMLRAGLCVTALVMVYLGLVHIFGRRIMRFFPKEMLVGILFAVGTVLPTWLRSPSERVEIAFVGIMFAVLCWLNCMAIERWEQKRIGVGEEMDSPGEYSIATVAVILAAVATAVWAFTPFFTRIPDASLSLSTALGALGIAALDRFGDSFSTEMLRVAADLCLLAPALVIPRFFGL